MNRASLRAALLLLGFRHATKHTYAYKRGLYDRQQQCMFIHVVVHPCWFTVVASDYGMLTFVSTKKAWRYINKIVQSYEQ